MTFCTPMFTSMSLLTFSSATRYRGGVCMQIEAAYVGHLMYIDMDLADVVSSCVQSAASYQITLESRLIHTDREKHSTQT